MNKHDKEQAKMIKHLYARATNALLGIEAIGLAAKTVLESKLDNGAKVEMLTSFHNQIMNKVMEGTSSIYSIKE